jgi:hypothetical protein
MEGMITLAESEHIKIDYYSFNDPLKGIYFVKQSLPPVIGLDYSLQNDLPLLRSVLAEELGHHFTNVGNCIPRQFFSARQHIDKAEYKALRWAANWIVNSKLNNFFKGIHSILDWC